MSKSLFPRKYTCNVHGWKTKLTDELLEINETQEIIDSSLRQSLTYLVFKISG
jgi:hypothetical protein